MNLSNELVNLVVDATNKAIANVQHTDGPLRSFLTIETPDGGRGEKELPDGSSDEDLVRAASMEGVQRFALLSSGSMQTDAGTVPVLLIHAAERGDPSGHVLAQRFVPGASRAFAELDGQIEVIQPQQNHFRFAPFRISDDPSSNAFLLQESFVRFAKRMMTEAFGDPDPRVLSVALTMVYEEDEADASFSYVHEESATLIRVTMVNRNNAFLPVSLVRLDGDGNESELPEHLSSRILSIYQM